MRKQNNSQLHYVSLNAILNNMFLVFHFLKFESIKFVSIYIFLNE